MPDIALKVILNLLLNWMEMWPTAIRLWFLPTHGRMLFLGLATQVLRDNGTFTALGKSNHGDMALTSFNHRDQGWGVNYTRHAVATTQSPEYLHRCVVLEKFNLWTLSNFLFCCVKVETKWTNFGFSLGTRSVSLFYDYILTQSQFTWVETTWVNRRKSKYWVQWRKII